MIQGEHAHRGPADGTNADDLFGFPGKVLVPAVLAWMIEADKFAGERINSAQVRSLVQIATITCECQIAIVIGPTVLPGDYMLYVMRRLTVLLPKLQYSHRWFARSRTKPRVAASISTLY